MDKITKIKLEMADLGWEVEEKISTQGWRNSTGYTIWFKRSDWHGKLTYSLTGHEVVFVGTTRDVKNEQAVLETVRKTAEKAKKAYEDFKTEIPFQTAKGEVKKDVVFFAFEDGKDIPKKKRKETM